VKSRATDVPAFEHQHGSCRVQQRRRGALTGRPDKLDAREHGVRGASGGSVFVVLGGQGRLVHRVASIGRYALFLNEGGVL
jgi:hypothetical protein